MTLSHALDASAADLRRLQRRRKQVAWLAVVPCALLLTGVESAWRPALPVAYALITNLGLFLIAACIVGRTWCTLYIGGHKKRSLTVHGPYSVVRNPLYVFTIMGTAGVGAQSGSLFVTLFFAASTAAMFLLVVRHEERFLASTFGEDFIAYARRVPRFWPRFSLWQEAPVISVNPYLVRRSFLEGCVYLIALPLAELVNDMHDDGWFPGRVHLP
jgi:protein-S-isoprenylcysteine O-methyltransferase Ste14